MKNYRYKNLNISAEGGDTLSRWKVEEIAFETMREADVWADSIANEMYGKLYDSYSTTDYKVACAFFRLAAIENCRVCTEDKGDGLAVYADFDT